MEMLSEIQKLRSEDARNIINNLVTDSLTFAEFSYWLAEYDAPAWFDAAKCWHEETGEEAKP